MGARLGRLTRHSDFDRVFREGRRGRSDLLLVRAVRTGREEVRVGFVIGHKVGGAVARNRIRRRVREALRSWVARLPGGVDLVITPSAACVEVPFERLREALRSALKRAGAWLDEATTQEAGRAR